MDYKRMHRPSPLRIGCQQHIPRPARVRPALCDSSVTRRRPLLLGGMLSAFNIDGSFDPQTMHEAGDDDSAIEVLCLVLAYLPGDT